MTNKKIVFYCNLYYFLHFNAIRCQKIMQWFFAHYHKQQNDQKKKELFISIKLDLHGKQFAYIIEFSMKHRTDNLN